MSVAFLEFVLLIVLFVMGIRYYYLAVVAPQRHGLFDEDMPDETDGLNLPKGKARSRRSRIDRSPPRSERWVPWLVAGLCLLFTLRFMRGSSLVMRWQLGMLNWGDFAVVVVVLIGMFLVMRARHKSLSMRGPNAWGSNGSAHFGKGFGRPGYPHDRHNTVTMHTNQQLHPQGGPAGSPPQGAEAAEAGLMADPSSSIAVGVLAVLLVVGSLVAFASLETAPQIREVFGIVPAEREQAGEIGPPGRAVDFLVNFDENQRVPAEAAVVTKKASPTKNVALVFGPKDPLVDIPPDLDKVTFVSGEYGTAQGATDEVMQRISVALPMILSSDKPLPAVSIPSNEWIKKNLIRSQSVLKHEETSGKPATYEARVELDLSPHRREQLYAYVVESQTATRTSRVAHWYLGSVLLLGALAMFLRLGTGIRPGSETTKPAKSIK